MPKGYDPLFKTPTLGRRLLARDKIRSARTGVSVNDRTKNSVGKLVHSTGYI